MIGARNAALKAQQRRKRTGAEAAPSTPPATPAAVTPAAKAGATRATAATAAARAPVSTVAAGADAALRAGKQAIKLAPTPAVAAAAAAQKGALAAQQQVEEKKAAAVVALEKAKKSVATAAATGAKAKQAAAKAKQTAATAAAAATAATGAVDRAGLPKDTRPPGPPPAIVEPPLDPAEAAQLDALINPPYGHKPVSKDFPIIAQVVPAGKPTPRSDHVPDCLNFSLTGSSTASGSSGSTGVLGRRTSRVAWAPTQVLTQEFARGG
jgi:hypothetical protein